MLGNIRQPNPHDLIFFILTKFLPLLNKLELRFPDFKIRELFFRFFISTVQKDV